MACARNPRVVLTISMLLSILTRWKATPSQPLRLYMCVLCYLPLPQYQPCVLSPPPVKLRHRFSLTYFPNHDSASQPSAGTQVRMRFPVVCTRFLFVIKCAVGLQNSGGVLSSSVPVWAVALNYSASTVTVYDYHGKQASCAATVTIWVRCRSCPWRFLDMRN